ncbi:(Fe-S)-binding protein [Granulicella tundricola]|uniref:4Fe-4S ferredoxin-type domain-containing protein n=1 Tax=Granulicella tundricola (strain ATCC BAA-1859 / DSM 23138 / MP5ACTX9) TaxID=1198114 RepID=E8X2K2_GRATM|nr:(Fe-S)-binding protein [Granulicella tundricola]ADW69226.1 protein of unknown function DUF224 cysteine-rich region domain protein [Granulicella tundricola MP5ACTX9]
MLSLPERVAFLLFALVTGAIGAHGFYRLGRRIGAGRADTDARWDRLPGRAWYALVTTLTQRRTFRKRPWVSSFHSLIFYGFVFYLLVNLVDALEGFFPFTISSGTVAGGAYNLLADVLSALVLVGVVALVLRRFLLPSRRDFSFNERTLLHKDVKEQYVTRDSVIVSVFILFHVGSRAVGAGARIAEDGADRLQPFATLLSHLFTPGDAHVWQVFGYWGALGSVLAFLMYFPRSKHIHIFMAPLKYVVARPVSSGVLPALELNMEAEEPKLGAKRLEDLAWPRLLDAYACIQCNRCQDVCPATATGKALSPSALEINKRMELNELSRNVKGFEQGEASSNPLLGLVLSAEAAWACTTCGACIEVCPVQDEPMLDIIDIRRQQVMIEGEFPAQLQTAFRGMERTQNPWGINHEKRMDWADGLRVRTTDENPTPDVLFWVGCAASYDPQSQKTARAFVQLLDHAGVDFAVLGKRECCTGDTARRAGNEYLYRQLADKNVATLNEVKPKLIVATCPHCMNSVGKEYGQIGGDFKVMHHTEYLETLVASGKLQADMGTATVTYHDPCYLGRHNGVYDAPRNLLNVISNDVVELDRNRENSFCCGAGGAQFWKEEEAGDERISDNRFGEVKRRLEGAEEKVLAVGCPFCKSMLESTPSKGADAIAVKDVAELLLEGVRRRSPVEVAVSALVETSQPVEAMVMSEEVTPDAVAVEEPPAVVEPQAEMPATERAPRKKWVPKGATVDPSVPPKEAEETPVAPVSSDAPKRKTWTPKRAAGSPLEEKKPDDPESLG